MPQGERRLVTVLFADLSGFTSLSETLDPEEVHEIVNACLVEMAAIVDRLGGTVDKYIGDELMANFGAPRLHEDDAERAIHAALAIRDCVSKHSVRGTPLEVHVGINTGTVVASAVGAEVKAEYTVMGDSVNVAARLLQAASANEVLVGQSTYRLAAGAFDFAPVRWIEAKGKSQPLAVYAVAGEKAARISTRGLEGLKAGLVGRQDELQQLLDALRRLSAGRLQVAGVVGEAGAGKSRLVSEFLGRAPESGPAGLAVYSTTCPALGGGPYQVPRDIICAIFALDSQDGASANGGLRKGVEGLGLGAEALEPILKDLISADGVAAPASEETSPEVLKRQLLYAVAAVCDGVARRQPTLLVVDDLHWADAGSLEVIRYVIDRLHDRPIFWLLSARPVLDTTKLFSTRAACTLLRLPPLGERECMALLAEMFGPPNQSFGTEDRAFLVHKAGGNPFYLEELVRTVIGAGFLVKTDSGWECRGDVNNCPIPDTLNGVVMARIDRLSPEAKQVIQVASVIGTQVDMSLLESACPGDACDEGVMRELEEAELFARPLSAGLDACECYFKHSLIQEVVYESLLLKRRRALHAQVADEIERQYADDLGSQVLLLAEHYHRAEIYPKASHYLVQAGHRSYADYAYEDASRYYVRALADLNNADDPALRTVALEGLADALSAVGELEGALQRWSVALDLRTNAGDMECVARLHRKMGNTRLSQGERGKAREHYESGLAVLDGAGSSVELAQLSQELGRLAFRLGDNQAATDWALRALALAEQLGAYEVVAQACTTLAAAKGRAGQMDSALEYAQKSLETALQQNLASAACRAYVNLATLYAPTDREKSIQLAEKGLELARKVGDLAHQAWLYAAVGGSYCSFTGDCTAGLEAASRSAELDRRLGQLDHLAVPLIIVAQIHQCHGDPQNAEPYYLEALELAEKVHDPQLMFPCYDGLATLYLERGEEEKGMGYLEKGQKVSQEFGAPIDSMTILPFLC